MNKYIAKVTEEKYVTTIAKNTYDASLDSTLNITIASGGHYDGDAIITPNNTQQVLVTAGLIVDSNITINPIPSNYGLVSWNGNVLTIS